MHKIFTPKNYSDQKSRLNRPFDALRKRVNFFLHCKKIEREAHASFRLGGVNANSNREQEEKALDGNLNFNTNYKFVRSLNVLEN